MRSTFIACTILAITLAVPLATRAADRPNIVLIMADDLGFEALGCYGGETFKTPHIDSLASAGVQFDRCYATPLCSPTRVQLMTGRYPFRTGWINLIGRGSAPLSFFDPAKERTFGHLLQQAGYKTAVAGKWQLADLSQHPDHIKDCGFDEYCCWTWIYKGESTSRYWNPTILQNGKLREDLFQQRYGPDVYNEFVIDFITRHREEPFFVYYPMALPHNPPHRTPDNAETDRHRDGRRFGTPEEFPGLVEYMDKLVGRIVTAIDRLKLRDKTLILFTTDNGTHKNYVAEIAGVKVRGGKGKVNEAGSHVPLIASWNGVTAAKSRCDDLIDFSDFLPTLVELSGAKLPSDRLIDGHSFVQQLYGKSADARDWVYVQFENKWFVRGPRWKLHHDGRFFDMQRDPFELRASIAENDRTREMLNAGRRLQTVVDQLHKP
jgi:arylsulfatase A-like enzyme